MFLSGVMNLNRKKMRFFSRVHELPSEHELLTAATLACYFQAADLLRPRQAYLLAVLNSTRH